LTVEESWQEDVAVLEPLFVICVILEIMFLAAVGRFAWRQRTNRFVFWGWLAVLAMFAVIDYWALFRK
jgi:hypothetical protein